jgi:hypothetical protein
MLCPKQTFATAGVKIPAIMQEMNYGCGTTVQVNELGNSPTVLYVGVGGGLEALQFAYFSRRPGESLRWIQCRKCVGQPKKSRRSTAGKSLV